MGEEQDMGAPSDGLLPSVEPVVSTPDGAAIPSAADTGKACAEMLDPLDFEPFIKRATDDIYERLMFNVQEYLRENTEYNIAAELEAAKQRELAALRLLHEVDDALGMHRWPDQRARIFAIEQLRAKAIEARQGGGADAVHESADLKGFTPPLSPPNSAGG